MGTSMSNRRHAFHVVHPTILLCLMMVALGLTSSSAIGQVGLLPVPVLQNVQVQAEASFDSSSQLYTYTYTVNNPTTNTGEIFHWGLDVTTQIAASFGSSGLTIPYGAAGLIPFDQELAGLQPMLLPPGTSVIPFGQLTPPGWTGGLTRDGLASFFSHARPNRITPGSSLGGFQVISGGPPTILKGELSPFWIFTSEGDGSPAEEQRALQTEAAIIFHTMTLGPSALTPGSMLHWNQVRDTLNQAIQLGWITDSTLATALVGQLASARQALDVQDGTTAKARLQPLIQTITQSTPAQRRQEAFALVLLNAQALQANTPDTPVPFVPQIRVAPQSSTLPLGNLYTLTATVVNVGAPTTPPVPAFSLGFRVAQGPQAGVFFRGLTDAQGNLRFSYVGTQTGTDTINVGQFGEIFIGAPLAQVTWSGGPDLVVPLFIPPVLNSKGGTTVFVTESTANTGTTAAAAASITRYFISFNPVVDPTTARVLGERPVPALGPGEKSAGGTLSFTLPGDLATGIYYLAACADATNLVVELNEQNNCSFSQLTGQQSAIVPGQLINLPPDCSKAAPSQSLLWPPNHKFVPISILGVTDPDQDPVTLTVTGISQDEPVHVAGSGNTGPDGSGVGTPQAQVRAERSGTGNGRLYFIAFTADDGKGATCTSTVTVGVPHDQGQNVMPMDTGQRYDSTQP